LSDAVAFTVIVPLTVASFAGEVIETVGGVVSAVTVNVALLLGVLPTALLTTTRKAVPLSDAAAGGVV
jgi:hypothetical protein